MYKTVILGLYDKKAATYAKVWMDVEVTAVRQLKIEASSNEESLIYKYPEEFRLVRLGTVDTDTGEINNGDAQIIAEISALITKDENNGTH